VGAGAAGSGAWLVVGDAPHRPSVELLALALRTAIAAMSHADVESRDGPTHRETPPGLDEENSRMLELTIGPIELGHSFDGIVGRSAAMTKALGVLDRLADSDVPVLLTGETGTGKEVFARALHTASARATKAFVAVNCTAVPAALFEAELFGYRRGAFTGAVRDHAGYVREADGGVLFLDEVGDMPLEVQPKLLRLLQEKTVRAVGGDRELTADVRLVAATNRDLAADVAAGRFRADLFYRINVVEIRLPPLRERAPDIPELVRHLLSRSGRDPDGITPKAIRNLVSYEWPGNVRELENELQRANVLAGRDAIDQRHLSQKVRAHKREHAIPKGTLAERLLDAERRMVIEALERLNGNRTHAARALGLSRAGLFRKMQRLGLLSR
jgi:transcriptional regulator with PAS, ATPase and Fis domain